MDDVKNLYKTEFDEARLEYNSKQKRDDRKIDDYFTNISNNIKNDLACEIIIELGDKKYWDTKDINYKKKMTNVFIEQVKDLELLVPNFKIASAIIHYDETSPHLHIVGVPIKYKNKNGMSKQVCKSDVFTKSTLVNLQDKMRTLCIDSFNKEYKTFSKLTEKKKGRNLDYNVFEMTNYQKVKDEISKNQKDLDIINQKSLELDNDTTDIKNIINIIVFILILNIYGKKIFINIFNSFFLISLVLSFILVYKYNNIIMLVLIIFHNFYYTLFIILIIMFIPSKTKKTLSNQMRLFWTIFCVLIPYIYYFSLAFYHRLTNVTF